MLPKLSAILFIVSFSSCAVSVNGKSCKKLCVTVRKCTDGLCDEPSSYPEYLKCEIKCDSDQISATTGNVDINRHSLSDDIDDEEVSNSDDNLFKINDIRDLRNDFSNERNFDIKSRDSDVIAVLIANDDGDDRDFRQQDRNMVYKSSSLRTPTTHPFNRPQHHISVTYIYPDYFRQFLQHFIRKHFSDNKALRKKNVEIIGLRNDPLDVKDPEKLRRVKRTVGKTLLDRLNVLGARFGASLLAAVAGAGKGSIRGRIGGSFGLKRGPGGIMADISGGATGQASGYISGAAGIATNAGLVRQSDLLGPQYSAGVGTSTSVGGGLGGNVAGTLGGSLGLGLGRGLTGVRASLYGGVSGQLNGYGNYQSKHWGGFGGRGLGGFGG